MTSFIELPVNYRVMFVEDLRRRMYESAERVGHPFSEDQPLSDAAVIWLDRMRAALCDTQTTDESIAVMDRAMREALPSEADELKRRLGWFTFCRDSIPLTARKPEQALRPAFKRLVELQETPA